MERVPKQVRVLILHDHQVVSAGIRAVLESVEGVAVCGEAASTNESLRIARDNSPDVAVVDLMLGEGSSGIDAIASLRTSCPAKKIVAVAPEADRGGVVGSMVAGASAVLLQQSPCDELVRAVLSVASGSHYLDPAVAGVAIQVIRECNPAFADAAPKERLARLTPRETRILTLIAQGKTNQDIADELQITAKTVGNHVSRILFKLEIKRRGQAVALFYLADSSP